MCGGVSPRIYAVKTRHMWPMLSHSDYLTFAEVFLFTFVRFYFMKVACTGKVELLVANGERNDLCAVNDLCTFSVHGTARSNARFQVMPWCKWHRRSSETLHSVYSYRRFGTTYRTLEDETDRLSWNVGNYKRYVTSQNNEYVSTKLYRRTKISSMRCSVGYSRHGTACRQVVETSSECVPRCSDCCRRWSRSHGWRASVMACQARAVSSRAGSSLPLSGRSVSQLAHCTYSNSRCISCSATYGDGTELTFRFFAYSTNEMLSLWSWNRTGSVWSGHISRALCFLIRRLH